ncbi:hypothetical protein AST13_02360 [Staphylococcus xylosus]|uniref:phage tail tape measure protein n=1 Tax=Staphylococcus xylosus TaxID=1288 RepID=UPI000853AAF3|nr:phage tail tape measure protein [Staphylococcus xylosus]OEL06901.1 hypothetical protein AST13_02360 [Staphylococcus xylosus]
METVQGMTIKNTMDNSSVEEGMRRFKRQMGVLNSEMKANMSAFERSEKSVQKYQTRLDSLNKKMDIQKKLYDEAKHELKSVQIAYEKATKSIDSQEKEVKKLAEAHKKYDEALKKSNSELKKSEIELEKARAQERYYNAEKAKSSAKIAKLREEERKLRNSGKATTEQVKQATEAKKREQVEYRKLQALHKTSKNTIDELKNANKRLKDENKAVGQSHKASSDALKEAERVRNNSFKTIKDYSKNLANAEKAMNREKASMNSLQKAINKTEQEFKQFNKEQMIANSHFTRTAEQMDGLSAKYDKFSQGMRSLGRNMSMYVTTPIVGIMGYASKLGVEFDDGMRKVQAISGATGKDLDALKAKAREMGATTKFSASDSAEALNYMAMAGWKSQDMIKGLPGVMDLAAASGENLGMVSDIVTDGLTAFGLQAKDSGHFADVLASASANANTNVSMMGEGFKYAAPVAGALGYSIEDVSLAIGLMSNAGVKGEKAGTALRTMFTNLSKPTKAMKNQMEKLGISITNSSGEMLPMKDVLDQLRSKFKHLSKDQQASAAATIFGKEAMSGALAIINASESDYNKLSKAINNSEGSAKKMADTMEAGLGGSLRELRSASEELALSVFETLQPALSVGVDVLKTGVDALNALPKGAKATIVGFMGVAAAIGPVTLGLGLLLRASSSAAKGYAMLNRRMAENSAEATINAMANTSAGMSMSKSGEKAGLFGRKMTTLLGPFGKFNKKSKNTAENLSRFARVSKRSAGGVSLLGGSFKLLGHGLKILSGPVGWTVTGLVTLGGLFAKAYKEVDWFRNGINGLGDVVKVFTGGALGDLNKGLQHMKDKFIESQKENNAFVKSAKSRWDGLVKDVKPVFDFLSTATDKASDSTKVLGKGVSKETEKALDKYVNYSEESSRILEQVKLNHGDISKEKANELLNIEKKLSDNLTKQYEKRKEDEINNTKKVLEFTESFTEKEKEKILQKTIDRNNKEIEEQNKLNEAIDKLKRKQVENGKLTPYELNELQELENKRAKITTSALTKTEQEQQKILSRMKQNNESYSVDEASKAIERAEKARKARLKEIEKEYEDQVYAIEQNQDLTKEQREKALNEAERDRNEKIKMANSTKDELVDLVKKQNEDIEEEMDLSNGRVYSNSEKWWYKTKEFFKKDWNDYWAGVGDNWNSIVKFLSDDWNDFWEGFRNDWNSITSFFTDTDWKQKINDGLSGLGNWIASPFIEMGEAWKTHFNEMMSDVSTGWFNVTDWIIDVKEKADDFWNQFGISLAEKSGSFSAWFVKKGREIQSNFENGWNEAWEQAGDIWSKVSEKVSNTWENVKSSTRNKLEETKQTATDKSWGVYKGTSTWFGEAYNTAKDKVTGILNRTRERFTDTAKTAGDKAYSVMQSTSKWFGKAYDIVDNRTGGMLSRAKDNFINIADEGWKKAKSVYNGFTTWLGRTLNWIRNVGKDFGKAAGDLGRTVANKAIGGLNGMIGGINKIAKAITGNKQLITPIPTLSTGTLDGNNLPTDSNGGLKQSTIAMVNDKGPGNAPDGGVQEIIHRADGRLEMPTGRNRLVHLGAGDSVINARDTRRMKQSGLLTDDIPRFSRGSKDWMKRLGFDKLKDKASNAAQTVKEHGEKGLGAVKKGAEWLGDKIGDVWDYMSNPGKLVDKVMSSMNINFGLDNNVTVKLVKAAYKNLTKSLVKKVKSWFDEFGGGDGSVFSGYPILQPFSAPPKKPNPNYPFNGGVHYGIDYDMPENTPVRTPMGGKIRNWFDNGGGGNAVTISKNGTYLWFMHLNKQLRKQGEIVKSGDLIAKSGNTGSMTNYRHLHFQVMKGSESNRAAIDPEPWLAKNSGSSVQGSGAAFARRVIQQAQGILGGKFKSNYVLSNMMKLVERESGFNPNAINNWDINAQRGTPSKGLFQMILPTFLANAKPGFTNFNSPIHQAISSMRYIERLYGMRGFPRAAARAYENGGVVRQHQFAEIAEKNREEVIVPMHSSKRSRGIQLLDYIVKSFGLGTKQSNVVINNDYSKIENTLKTIAMLTDENNNLTKALIAVIANQKGDSIDSLLKILNEKNSSKTRNGFYKKGVALN